MLSVCTMYGGKLILNVWASAKLAKIQGLPGWSGGVEAGGLMNTVSGRKTILSVPPAAPGRSIRMVPDGPRKSTSPLAPRGVADVPFEEPEKVMAKALVTDRVLVMALVTADRAWGEAGDVTVGRLASVAPEFAELQAVSPVTARAAMATATVADRVGSFSGTGLRATRLVRRIGA